MSAAAISLGSGRLRSWIAAFVFLALPARAEDSIEGGGFEGDPPTNGWSVHVYGAKPEISADTETRQVGRQSLRISSREPSDTALGQNLLLPPGAVYRLRGWVRVRDLHGEPGVRVGGTFQIQDHGGAPRVSGKSRFGTTDWVEETVVFRVPADGKVRIAVFFIGFGKGTGTAWFDDLRLERVEDRQAETIRVKASRLSEAPVSPFQFGQFVELLADLVPAMQAERLSDDSFEGSPPFKVQFRPQIDARPRPWYPSGAAHRGAYDLDKEEPWNGAVSQRIRVGGSEPCWAGISQDGVWFAEGQALRLRVYLRGEAPAGATLEARARLGGEGRALARANLGKVDRAWRLHQARLVPAAACRDAVFTIELRGPGTMWIDRVSLVPEDAAPGGWRPDVVAALRDMKPGIIRFGGSVLESYEWEGGVGDVGKRVPFPNAAWGGLDPNTVGIDEFIELCRLVDAEPLICVRWTGKTPRDAADQVEYANGPPSTPGGRKRAANGHPEPFRVKYWQVGNEVAGAQYEGNAAEFARAMKAVDPSIKVLSSFPSEKTLETGADVFDHLCPHHYACADLSGVEADLLGLRDLVKRRGKGRPIRLAITEWNTTAGDWGLGRWSLLTLENALKCSRYHHLLHRHADLVEIAIRSNLANSFCSGFIQTRGPDLVLSPAYHAQKLYARSGGDFPLAVEVEPPPTASELDVSATVSATGKTMRIYAVNESSAPARRTVVLEGLGRPAGRARLFTVTDRVADRAADRVETPDRQAANWFDEPERVRTIVSGLDLPGPSFDHVFPALSVTLIEVDLDTR